MGRDDVNTLARITNVLVDGRKTHAALPPKTVLTVTLDYELHQLPGCPSCIDQIQVGFAHTDPAGCVYDGIPHRSPDTGRGNFMVIAPSTAGTY